MQEVNEKGGLRGVIYMSIFSDHLRHMMLNIKNADGRLLQEILL